MNSLSSACNRLVLAFLSALPCELCFIGSVCLKCVYQCSTQNSALAWTELVFLQRLIHILAKIHNFISELVYRGEKLRPDIRNRGIVHFLIRKHQRVTFFWPIYHRADRPTRSARWIKVKAKVRKMTATCENWHTRLFKLGPGEPKHKITSIPAALRGTVGKCDQQQHNNGEAGRGEGRSY